MNPTCNQLDRVDPGFTRLYIFGAGGFGKEVAWLAQQSWGSNVELIVIVDQESYLSGQVNGAPVMLASDVTVKGNEHFVVAVGNAAMRRRTVDICIAAGLRPATLVHPRVEMSTHVAVGEGSLICAGAIVTTNVLIGRHVHVNLSCTLGHDVRLGDYTTLSPGVHVSGHVEIGSDVFVGTGASIINGQRDAPLVIGDGAVIAAGSCVTRTVDPLSLMAGVPAVRKR